MKKLCKSIKTSFILCLILSSFSLLADEKKKTAPIGLALTVEGQAFVVSENRTRPLETSDYIYDLSEIVTSDDGQVTFKDRFDHKYHIASGSHVKFLNRIIELRGGYIWTKSQSKEKGFSIQTTNAKINYQDGESIVSFDPLSGKTQLLVVHGEMELSNILLDQNKVLVTDSSFSFLTGDLESGMPRAPTPIGPASFLKVAQVFGGIQAEQGELAIRANEKEKVVERKIASVEEKAEEKTAEPKAKKVEKIYEEKLKKMSEKKKVSKVVHPQKLAPSTVKVIIYGQGATKAPISVPRLPASEPAQPTKVQVHDDSETAELLDQLKHFKTE